MPMMDRQIVVQKVTTTSGPFGEAQETTEDVPLWATRQDASVLRELQSGGAGARSIGTRGYTIRYRRDFAEAVPGELRIVDGDFAATVRNIVERQGPNDQRRRFLILETIGEQF